jgi:ADP-ribose pyrophosphatase YjhB (NUDIX family)
LDRRIIDLQCCGEIVFVATGQSVLYLFADTPEKVQRVEMREDERKDSTQREYPRQPLVGVGALIIQNGRVALIKRGHAPLLGEWSIPGGLLELGETVRQGAEREALEETSLRVRATDLLGVFDRVLPDDDKRTLYHYVLIDFLCEVTGGELQASGDAADARWFTPKEVSALPLAADTAEVIQAALSRSGL